MRIPLIIVLSAFTAWCGTTNVRIYHQAVASPASVQSKQIGVNTSADANLGYKMWFGKDADGSVTSFIAKSKPALFTSVRQDSSFSLRDTSKLYKGDSAFIGGMNATRLYFGVQSGTSIRADSVFSIRDTSKLMKADSGCFTGLHATRFNFTSLIGTSIRIDTIYSKVDTSKYIKVDSIHIGNGTNYAEFDKRGHLTLKGDAPEWDDMDQFTLQASKNVGVTGFPTLTQTNRGFSEYSMATNDSCIGLIEHGHRFIEGDTCHPHVHYKTYVQDATQRYVKFSLHYLFTNINDSCTYEGTITKQDTIAANTKKYTAKLVELPEIPTPLIKLGANMNICIKRITASPDSAPTVNPFIVQFGIHKKIDCFGSRSELVK